MWFRGTDDEAPNSPFVKLKFHIQGGDRMYTCGGFSLIFGKTDTIM